MEKKGSRILREPFFLFIKGTGLNRDTGGFAWFGPVLFEQFGWQQARCFEVGEGRLYLRMLELFGSDLRVAI